MPSEPFRALDNIQGVPRVVVAATAYLNLIVATAICPVIAAANYIIVIAAAVNTAAVIDAAATEVT